VALAFAAGGLQGWGAGVGGEVIGRREAGDVTDVAEDLRGDDVPGAADVGDGGVRPAQQLPDLCLVGM
jgi:hypothetical protein